jgi:hypothetical protein
MAAEPVPPQIPLFTGPVLPSQFSSPEAGFDWNLLLFASWAVGVIAMLSSMAWAQIQFRKAERQGVAGPAVAGFFKPRIVIPADFAARFSPSEQAAVLAHEQAHLARQDARINAVVALLRCLCWFNVLVHLGALWLRRDQELACDAAALNRVPRIDYANALVKSHMPGAVSPLGCGWPGSEHPLTERVALLKFAARGRRGVRPALVWSWRSHVLPDLAPGRRSRRKQRAGRSRENISGPGRHSKMGRR